jgi:hypothetical protein
VDRIVGEHATVARQLTLLGMLPVQDIPQVL